MEGPRRNWLRVKWPKRNGVKGGGGWGGVSERLMILSLSSRLSFFSLKLSARGDYMLMYDN